MDEGSEPRPAPPAAPSTAPAPARANASTVGRRWLGLHRVSAVVLAVALVVAAALALGARAVRNSNEDRLLSQRAHEAATVVTAAVPRIQVPLTVAAALAQTTGGDPASFREVVTSSVGAPGPFVSASIWPAGSPSPRPLVVVGEPPLLAERPPERARRFLASTTGNPSVSVLDLLGSAKRRLGYAMTAPAGDAAYVVYAEAELPRNRPARVASNSAFADLGYALYLGRAPHADELLASSTGHGIPRGTRQARSVVPFGDSHILLVVTPTKELGGTLLARLPWLLALTGLVLAAAIALLVERLLRQRGRAERLAGELEQVAAENVRLYTEQRDIATTLQHSLMPDEIPQLAGVDAAARYEAGVAGTDVGGDWYDVIAVGPSRLVFSVGDVCGRGLEAAATMAALRYSMRAYALEGNQPAEILRKLGALLDVERDGQFATVICGILDTADHEVTVARAGHLDLLLVDETGARFLGAPRGLPIGIEQGTAYEQVTVVLADRGTLVAYTDGLVERRGEPIDAGLERLLVSAGGEAGSAQELIARVVGALTPDGSPDDLAVLALRWTRGLAAVATGAAR